MRSGNLEGCDEEHGWESMRFYRLVLAEFEQKGLERLVQDLCMEMRPLGCRLVLAGGGGQGGGEGPGGG